MGIISFVIYLFTTMESNKSIYGTVSGTEHIFSYLSPPYYIQHPPNRHLSDFLFPFLFIFLFF